MRDDEFEWDDRKAAVNLRDHKVSFDAARGVFNDEGITEWLDDGQDMSEDRMAAVGMTDNRLVFVSYTWRGPRIRIISARLAEPFERRKYHNGT
jgi:uncharacterized protein